MFSKVVLPIRCDIVTVSCNRHVIATSRLLAYSTFSRWYYNPFASSRLHPTSGNFDDDQRHTSSLTTRHDTNPFLVASPVSLSASLKAVTVRRKSRPKMLVIEVQRYCILKFQDPISVSIYRVLYSQSLRCFSAVSQLIDQPYFLFPFHEQSLPRVGIKIRLNTTARCPTPMSWLLIRKIPGADYMPAGATISNK